MHRARSATIHQEEPIWEQFCALLPERKTNHPLGCHRSRIPEKVVFGKLVPRSWCSAALKKGSPTSLALRARCVAGVMSGSNSG
jgi:hypothetical protein